MTDLDRAKDLLLSGNYTCVLCKNDVSLTSSLSGIAPMVKFLSGSIDLNGFSAADKIAGKAAAMLFVLAGVKEVYAGTMSEQAVKVFQKYDVKYSYDTLTPSIMNRAGTGLCPMEQAVSDIDSLPDAFEAIKHTLNLLSKHNG